MLINGGDPALGIASNNEGVPRRGFRQCKAGAVGCRGMGLVELFWISSRFFSTSYACGFDRYTLCDTIKSISIIVFFIAIRQNQVPKPRYCATICG